MTVKDRILAFLDVNDIKRGDFFDAFGLAPSNFRGQSKQSGLNSDTLVKILAKYELLSAEWLLRGEGDMYKVIEAEPKALTKDATIKEFFEQFDPYIARKDAKIIEQAEEIGRLKARIEELERRRGDNASDALTTLAQTG